MLNLKCFFLIKESTLVMQCNLETSSKNVNLLESKISSFGSGVERLVVVDEKFLLLCPDTLKLAECYSKQLSLVPFSLLTLTQTCGCSVWRDQ